MKQRIGEIVSKLTLEEKVSLLVGASGMDTAAIERLGIKAVSFCDGPHGVRIDPFHTGALGAAYIGGLQDNGVGACAKHYAINNQETDVLPLNKRIQ